MQSVVQQNSIPRPGSAGNAQSGVRQSNMAQLHRFVKLNDRFDTHVFTFVVPGTILKEYSPDVFSRDFMYGYQKWCICLVRSDRHVGAFLTLRNVTEGMIVKLDFSFTVVNKEHFTKNESTLDKDSEFNSKNPMNGRKTFIGVTDICERKFLIEEEKILLELEMRNIKTSFEEVITLPRDPRDQQNVANNFQKFETSYFAFGGCDWNVSIFPNGDCAQNEGKPTVHLSRQTGLDHCCKIRYRVTVGHGDRTLESEILDDFVDISGNGLGYNLGASVYSLATHKGRLKVKVDLYNVTAISEVQICPLDRRKNRSRCYDREKQAWVVESDMDESYLRLRLFYADIYNIPRHYTRFVCWNLSILPVARTGVRRQSMKAIGAPFSNYYTQTDVDEGYDMLTQIPINEINGPESVYLEEGTRKLTLQIEWLDSHLLLHDAYHRLDDITRLHKHQMKRELLALQAENYALEKQVHSYQQSIAKNNARGRFTDDHMVLHD